MSWTVLAKEDDAGAHSPPSPNPCPDSLPCVMLFMSGGRWGDGPRSAPPPAQWEGVDRKGRCLYRRWLDSQFACSLSHCACFSAWRLYASSLAFLSSFFIFFFSPLPKHMLPLVADWLAVMCEADVAMDPTWCPMPKAQCTV